MNATGFSVCYILKLCLLWFSDIRVIDSGSRVVVVIVCVSR